MHIRLIEYENGDDVTLYERLVREHGTVFNSGEWVRLFGNRLLRYGIYGDREELIGGFCLYRDDKYGFPILRNPPFTPMCGPFIKVEGAKPISILETKRKALTAMASLLDQYRYSVISVSLDRRIDDALPFYWSKFKTIPSYTYLIDLTASVETIKQQMTSARRNSISKALKDGVAVKRITDMTIVRKFVLDTYLRQNKRINAGHLDAILFKFSDESNSVALAAYWNGALIACVFNVYDSRTVYGLMSGHSRDVEHPGAVSLLIFESILQAKERGLQTFDFSGSVVPPIEHFLRSFGGKLTPYFTVNKAWLPIEVALKFRKRELF